jgi:hypothetical protein
MFRDKGKKNVASLKDFVIYDIEASIYSSFKNQKNIYHTEI